MNLIKAARIRASCASVKSVVSSCLRKTTIDILRLVRKSLFIRHRISKHQKLSSSQLSIPIKTIMHVASRNPELHQLSHLFE